MRHEHKNLEWPELLRDGANFVAKVLLEFAAFGQTLLHRLAPVGRQVKALEAGIVPAIAIAAAAAEVRAAAYAHTNATQNLGQQLLRYWHTDASTIQPCLAIQAAHT